MTSRMTQAYLPVVIDRDRWPGVATAPGSGLRAVVARAMFTAAVGRLPLLVRLPDGGTLGAGSADDPVMVIHRPDRFFRRLGAGGLVGFGESYMAGEWDCDDLTALLAVFAAGVGSLVPPRLQRLRALAVPRQPLADRQSREGSRRNIGRHYDLSNEMFALFLDETMTYSSALFATGKDGAPVAAGNLLAEAQRRKIDLLLDRSGVGPGTRLLEIGTGWGELAIRAAGRGATVRTITISRRQYELASARVADAGVSGRVNVELRDYREVHGQYDAICSSEMIEAVGERYWGIYFAALDRLLAPGGLVGLQAITMPHDRMLASRNTHTWIQKYIFPGGLIPSVAAIENSLATTALRIADSDAFGSHYAQTLRIWHERFLAQADEVRRLGFDDVFIRMWSLYLCYAAAGFRSGYLDVRQFTITRPMTRNRSGAAGV